MSAAHEADRRSAVLGAFYATNAARLQSSLARHLGSTQLAEDAMASAFAQLVARPDIDPADAGGWLFTVARREGYRLGEIARRTTSLDIEVGTPDSPNRSTLRDMIPSPEDTELITERNERLRGLDDLKPDQSRALRARAAGYSYQEIGNATGHTPTKINRSLAEGRATLRQRETELERQTQEYIHASRTHDPTPPVGEIDERRRRIAASRARCEIELGLELGR